MLVLLREGGLIENPSPFFRSSSSSSANLTEERLVTVSFGEKGSTVFFVRFLSLLRCVEMILDILLSMFFLRALFKMNQSTEFKVFLTR